MPPVSPDLLVCASPTHDAVADRILARARECGLTPERRGPFDAIVPGEQPVIEVTAALPPPVEPDDEPTLAEEAQLLQLLAEFEAVPDPYRPRRYLVRVGLPPVDPGAEPHEHDVFISYSRRDRVWAEWFEARLREAGLTVWRDPELNREVDDTAIGERIGAALRASRRVVVLWSRHALASRWVGAEALEALNRGTLLGVLLEPLPTLPLPFNAVHAVSLHAVAEEPRLILGALGAVADGGRPGRWVLAEPQVDLSKLPETYAERLFGRDAELRDLLEAWDRNTAHVYVFDAIGGAGKTALIYHFVQALKASSWRGARRVFAWSFYSQGSNEDRQTSAEEFWAAAFAFFAPGTPIPVKAHDRGVALTEHVQRERSLLVLDGLEPLQYTTGRAGRMDKGGEGAIKDAGIRALLKGLVERNAGLCLVTTRIPIAELKGAVGAAFVALDRLPLVAAVELLRALGVEPRTADRPLPARAEFDGAGWTPPVAYDPPTGTGETVPLAVVQDLVEAVESLDGHALALTLAGRHVAEHEGGDVRLFRQLPSLVDIDDPRVRNPYRAMRAIEIAYARRIREVGGDRDPSQHTAGRQLALLFFLGLFDRPVETALLPVVFAAGEEGPADGPHTEADGEARVTAERRVLLQHLYRGMHRIGVGELRAALGALARVGLVAKVEEGRRWEAVAIDCHPLVREYFGARWVELDEGSFRGAHGRLYDHYRYLGVPEEWRNPLDYAALALAAKFPENRSGNGAALGAGRDPGGAIPPTLRRASPAERQRAARVFSHPELAARVAAFQPADEEGMRPLFTAMAHGCAAGCHPEVLEEVYLARISRGNEYFASKKLGLLGPELAAIAGLFEAPFDRPASTLARDAQRLVVNLAATRLAAVGRLAEAIAPERAGTRLAVAGGDWENAARGSLNVAERLVILGRLEDGPDGASAAVAEAVQYADRADDRFLQTVVRCLAGEAAFAADRLAQAEGWFRAAERIQRLRQPGLPRLYSLQGASYAELLLARGRRSEAAGRAHYDLPMVREQGLLLDIGLDYVILARAADPGPAAGALAEQAVTALRDAGQDAYLAKGLLALAAARWRSVAPAAERPLREAEAIAERGPMPLVLCQAALLRARIALAAGEPAAAAELFGRASEIVAQTGYGAAAPEVAVLWVEIGAATGAADLRDRVRAAAAAIRGAPGSVPNEWPTPIDGGWWGLLPRFAAALDPADPLLAELRVAEAAYHAEREAHLAAEEAAADAEWAEEDRALADPAFRRALNEALVQSGYKPLDETPLSEQRNDARQFLRQQSGGPAGEDPRRQVQALLANPETRAQLTQALAVPEVRAAIDADLRAAGARPLDQLDPEQQLAMAAIFFLSRSGSEA